MPPRDRIGLDHDIIGGISPQGQLVAHQDMLRRSLRCDHSQAGRKTGSDNHLLRARGLRVGSHNPAVEDERSHLETVTGRESTLHARLQFLAVHPGAVGATEVRGQAALLGSYKAGVETGHSGVIQVEGVGGVPAHSRRALGELELLCGRLTFD